MDGMQGGKSAVPSTSGETGGCHGVQYVLLLQMSRVWFTHRNLLFSVHLQALKMYQEVLKSQPDNIYAVNGLGICLAELGHFNAAKQAFDEVCHHHCGQPCLFRIAAQGRCCKAVFQLDITSLSCMQYLIVGGRAEYLSACCAVHRWFALPAKPRVLSSCQRPMSTWETSGCQDSSIMTH